jgi:phytoene dehydrogenase-like protein
VFELLVERLLGVAVERHEEANWPFGIGHNWNCTQSQLRGSVLDMSEITVIGGGLAGLAAAITCAERGSDVKLFEAHRQLGGRARSTDGPYKANLGPHAIYTGGVLWDWLTQQNLMPPLARPPLTGVRFRYSGAVRRTPPLSLIPPGLRLRGRVAPVDQDFRSWVADHADEHIANFLSALAGVYTFYHDPGELSAAFVWGRTQRLLLSPRPAARFIIGGWTTLVDALERRARELGVQIVTGERIDAVPNPPVIVALELRDARTLLKDDTLRWPSGCTVCLDLGLNDRRGDPWVVSDLESAGWIERYTAQDPSLAPPGEALVQGQMPIRPGESPDGAATRLEELFDEAFEDWRERITWRRRQVMDGRSGAVDPPGTTWRDRPSVARGDGIFLCGDQVAADGCLSEVSFASAIDAGRRALDRTRRPAAARAA